MVALTASAIGAIAKIITPITTDLYKTAKNGAKTALNRWQEQQFPKRLSRKIGSISIVRTLWRPDDDVSLLTFYYSPKISSHNPNKNASINYISDIGMENIVIQGIVGQGKSILLRYLALQETKREGIARLPVFIELRTLQNNFTLRDAIYKTLSSYEIDIDHEAFDHLAASGKLVLLLDAFDELDESQVRGTLTEISYLARRYEEMQIVVTSRPENEIQKVPGFKIARINPLTENDYRPFLTKMGLAATKNAAVVEAIRNSPSGLANLITTPLMLTLVVIVYESEKEIPPTLPEFFEKLFHIVLTKHDRLKDGFNRKRHSGLSDKKLQDLFESFCFMAIQNGYGRSLSAEQFSKTFKQAIEYTEECRCDQDKFQADIVKVACLMLQEGVDTTTFLHKSLMEYYAAAFIKHSTDEVAELFYREVCANPKPWREVVRFLENIDSYRYSKNFALPQIAAARESYLQELSDRTPASLISFFGKKEQSNYTTYEKLANSQDEYYIAFYGSMLDQTYFSETLGSLLIHAIFASLPHRAKKSKVEEILGAEIDEISPIKIPFYRIIEYGDINSFFEAVTNYENWLNRQEDIANTIISRNEKRKDIFKRTES